VKVVVTGGAGFIGANLCRTLASHGITDVLALDDLSTGSAANLDGVDATFVEGGILDLALVKELLDGAGAVVHLAARPSVPRSLADPVASNDVNVNGTLTVLEAARAVGGVQVVVASSSSVYGANPTLPKTEELPTAPLSPYAVSKLATEGYALAFQHSFGVPALAFRFFNVFGPLQAAGHAYAAVIPAFVDAALAGRPLTIFGDGKQSRDFTYVETVTAVLTEAVLRQVTHDGPVNLAFGTRTDLLTVVETLGELLGRRLEVEHHDPRRGDVRHSQADNSRLRALFPEVQPVNLRDGLVQTIDWFERMAKAPH
jgi:UDP-glucose 4-epimerase